MKEFPESLQASYLLGVMHSMTGPRGEEAAALTTRAAGVSASGPGTVVCDRNYRTLWLTSTEYSLPLPWQTPHDS